MQAFEADFSLALLNATGAFHVGVEVLRAGEGVFSKVRTWRLHGAPVPSGIRRKVLGRLMLAELSLGRRDAGFLWPRGKAPMVFLDPLYVLQSHLSSRDIVVCHDMGPFSHPELFHPETIASYGQAFAKIVERQPKLIFVSDFTRREFGRLVADPARLGGGETIHLFAPATVMDGERTQPPSVTTPFLLMVGGLERRKNHLRVFEAYQKSGLHARGVSLVVVGPRGLDADKIRAASALTAGVVMLGFVSAAELRWLYASARGLVLPSLLEGFGVPALEAAAWRLPSVLSEDSALAEAVNDAAVLVEPQSVDSIAEGMIRLVDMPESERRTLTDRALSRVHEFTCERFQAKWRAVLRS